MLAAERNADNADVQQYAEEDMSNSSPQPAAKQPDNVEYSSEATVTTAIAYDMSAEGRQYYHTYFKTLQPERDAYYGEAQNDTTNKITQSTD